MQIKINLKPYLVGGKDYIGRWSSKEDVLRAIKGGTSYHSYYTASTTHSTDALMMRGDNSTVRVYSLEKRRKKVEVLPKPVKWTKKELRDAGLPLNAEKWHKRKVIHPTHWVGVLYDIPVVLLKFANLRVVQGERTFKFEQV